MTKGRIRLLLAGIISLLLLSSFSSWTIIRDGRRIEKAQQVYRHNLEARDLILKFIDLTQRSVSLSAGWVYLPVNDENKLKLRELQVQEFPALKNEMTGVIPDSLHATMASLVERFERMTGIQQELVMASLQTLQNYEDPAIMLIAADALKRDVFPAGEDIVKRLNVLEVGLNERVVNTWNETTSVIYVADLRSLIVSITIFAAGIIGLIIVLGAKDQVMVNS